MPSYLCAVNTLTLRLFSKRRNTLRLLSWLVLFVPVSFSSVAQTLELSSSALAFGDVFTDDPAELSLELTNTGEGEITISDANTYNPAFEALDTAWTIAAGAAVTITVRFSPRHNIPHNSELVLVTNFYEGNLTVDLTGRGVYPESYYLPTQDLSQEALKTALSNLIDGHISLGYTPARDEMYMVIDNQRVNGAGALVNTLEDCYTARIVAGYIDRTDAQNSDNVNTEHTWPQSEFGSAEPMQSDLFHLFISDANANSVRGNLPFGNVTTPDWTGGGSKRGGGVFEVRDAHKGRTARGMLYFYLHYGNEGSFLTAGQENVLRGWHRNFPPEIVEQRRNDAIFLVQDNRNPLIDHPEFDERISSYLSTAVEPVLSTVVLTETEANFGILTTTGVSRHRVVFVADGNQPISISGASVSHPDLSIASVPAEIAAGESGYIELSYSPTSTDVFSDTLFFTSTADNLPTGAVVIFGGATLIGLQTIEAASNWQSWFAGSTELQVVWGEPVTGSLRLFSLSGQLMHAQSVEGEAQVRVSGLDLPPAHYLLEWDGPFGLQRNLLYKP
ncbi:MAG: DUF1573 domain-containing protein [Bacteroidetes bacterium]|nr:DUF1573 domain-containing protein [Bacteroidota bacterium]